MQHHGGGAYGDGGYEQPGTNYVPRGHNQDYHNPASTSYNAAPRAGGYFAGHTGGPQYPQYPDAPAATTRNAANDFDMFSSGVPRQNGPHGAVNTAPLSYTDPNYGYSAGPNFQNRNSAVGPSYGGGDQQRMEPQQQAYPSNFPQHHFGSSKDMMPSAAYDENLSTKATSSPFVEGGAIGLGAPPEFCYPTMRKTPHSATLKQKIPIPIGVFVRAMAPSNFQIHDVPGSGSDGKVVRCHRCRTYMNCFVQFEAGGRRWSCNICGHINEVPNAYFCPLDEMGRRTDRLERPELHLGSVEFIAPSEYMIRPPQPPAYLFLIDVSYSSVASGLLTTVCQALKEAVMNESLPGGSRTLMGILTCDSSIHFYKLEASRPQLIVIPPENAEASQSTEEAFIPLAEGVLANLSDRKEQLLKLLEALPSVWAHQRVAEACFERAIKTAAAAIKPVGGKLSVFLSAPPTGNWSQGGKKDSKAGTAAEREVESLKPADPKLRDLATELTQMQASVDLWICPPTAQQSGHVPSFDLPTLAQLSQYSAGDVRYYRGFNALTLGDKLRRELVHVLTRESGWESVMRLRVSRGWAIAAWYGHFLFRHNDLLVLPNCHADQTITVQLELQDNVAPDVNVYLQAALLYTSSNGERRIRVHTISLPVSQNAAELTSAMDDGAVAAFLTLKAIAQANRTTLFDARALIQSMCTQICSVIAGHGGSLYRGVLGSGAPGESVSAVANRGDGASYNMPSPSGNNQSMIPYFLLGAIKSIALREGKELPADLRCAHWRRLSTCPLDLIIDYVNPKLYPLHELTPFEGMLGADKRIVLPETIPLTSASLVPHGVYLWTDSESIILWVGKAVEAAWLRAVFGVDSLDYVHTDYGDALLGTTGDALGTRVAAIVKEIRDSTLPCPKFIIARQGSPAEVQFFSGLIDDRTNGSSLSCADWMSKVTGPRSAGPMTHGMHPTPGGPSAGPGGMHSMYAPYGPTSAVSGGAPGTAAAAAGSHPMGSYMPPASTGPIHHPSYQGQQQDTVQNQAFRYGSGGQANPNTMRYGQPGGLSNTAYAPSGVTNNTYAPPRQSNQPLAPVHRW